MNKICYAEKMLVASMIVLAIALFANIANAQSISTEQAIELLKRKASLELGGTIAKGTSIVETLKIEGGSASRVGPWYVSGDLSAWYVNSDRRLKDSRKGSIEVDYYHTKHIYTGMEISISQDVPGGIRHRSEDYVFVGYDFGDNLWVDIGGGAFRTGEYDNHNAEITSTEYAAYLGGIIQVDGLWVKGSYIMGEDHSIGKLKAEYVVPMDESFDLKMTYSIQHQSPPPFGRPETETLIAPSIVLKF